MVLVWPIQFGLDHNDLVSTKMKWSRPKWIGQVQIVIFYQNESHLDLTNSFWLWPFHFGQDQIIMVKSKSIWSGQNLFWTDQNSFGHIEGQGIKLTYSVGWYWNNTKSPINILDKTFDPMWIRYPIWKFMNIIPNSFMFCVKNMGTIFADANAMLVNIVITIATDIRVLSKSEFQVGQPKQNTLQGTFKVNLLLKI